MNFLLWKVWFAMVGRILPFSLAYHVALPLSRLFWIFGLRKSVTVRNLSLAFPSLSESQRYSLAKKAYHSLLTVFLELPILRNSNTKLLSEVLSVGNLDLLRTIEDERGALLLSGHCGNWELLALSAAVQAERPFSIIVKTQKDYGELTLMRERFGNKMIPFEKGALAASRILSRGEVVAFLADQSAPPEDYLVDMFGIPTYTFSTPARLALRFRPKVIVGFAYRDETRRYSVELRELLYDDLNDDDEGAIEFTRRYVQMLESAIRSHPEQWMWQHKKWKHSPAIEYD